MKNEVRVLTKKQQKDLLKKLQSARKELDVEKAVERAVINMIETYFMNNPQYGEVTTTYDFNTDGIIEATQESLFTGNNVFEENNLTILLEAKRDKNFAGKKKDVLDTTAQVVSYLHTIKNDDPHKYPQVIVIADNNEIFLLPSIVLKPYLDRDYNWSLPASDMHKDTRLMLDLAEDKNIRPVINDIDKNFNVVDFCNRIVVLASEAGLEKIRINKKTLADAFEMFRKMVYGTNDPNVIQDENREQIELFCRTLFGDEEVYAHPKKPNTITVDKIDIPNMSSEGYEVFSSRYDANNYSLKEYMDITEMADTLIAEANRRFKGDYYTPEVWVNKAHEVITEALGEDWKDEYIVWDPAAGTKNLTRAYMFKDLYSSTLYKGELMSTQNFNKDNVAFQYDFLNDDMVLHDGSLTVEDIKNMSDEELEDTFKMDTGLIKKMINKEPIVFFANPPYGQATTGQTNDHKTGTANTAISELMRKQKLGHASGELYTQFIYRTQLLAEFFEYGDDDDFHFFFFNKGFLSSPSFGKFVDGLTSQFSFHEGFMLNAGEFNGTSAAWGIIFSHWSLDGDKNQKEFHFEVLKSEPSGNIKKITNWEAKRVSKGETISDWMKEVAISRENCDAPITQNGFDFPHGAKNYCNMKKDSIGYMLNKASSVQESEKGVGFFSLGYINAHGRDITKENFERIAVTFSIRRAVHEHIKQQKQLWIRDKDTFMKPSDELLTDEFITDCVVYSLFDSQSNQTSLRQYEYNGKTYRVINEFLPFSKEFIEKLSVKHNNMDIQSDLIGDKERFVYQWLEEHEEYLSDEAKDLLDKAEELYEITFEHRDDYAKLYPRYQTNSWDAGYAQIARLAFGNDRINDDYQDFKQEFYSLREALGETIAQAAFDDGII